MAAEHLVAIALRTGRAKDKIQIQQFIESGVLDAARLQDILTQHSLLEKWKKLLRQYGEESA